MKTCSRCKKLLARKNFYIDKDASSGLYSACKKCHNDYFYSKDSLTRKLVNAWRGINGRCFNKSNSIFRYYGARGIKVEWETFDEFVGDMKKGFLSHIRKFGEKDTTLDRINVNGNYCKENCRWATQRDQQNNRRNNRLLTFRGKTQSVGNWAHEIGLSPRVLHSRIYMGWSVERLLTTPKPKRYL